MRRIRLLPAVGLGLALVTRLVLAQAPQVQIPNASGQPGGLNGLIQTSREDINAAYAVTPEGGSWMICVASYQGESSAELAYQLCTYLRQKHYPAYVYNRGSAERKKLQEELDQQQKLMPGVPRRRKLAHPDEDQFAVLLGGFRDIDAANAQLKKVRTWDLPDIKLKSGKPAFDTYDLYEPGKDNKVELKRYPVNPFHTAMVVPNPTTPPQPKPIAKVDPFLKSLNANEPRSIFKCPKKWTLAVQEFRGASAIQTTSTVNSFWDKLGFGDHPGQRLDNAARMAQQVCDMFKKLGFKSYVLHTRYNSVVTVGEFDGRDDPAMQRTQEQLKRLSFRKGSATGDTAFNLFATALPMEVPH
jgi:cell division septation protein DedD